MSMTDVYLAGADDAIIVVNQEALRAGTHAPDGIPRGLTPLWPHPGAHLNLFHAAGDLGGERVQTDWGCTAYIVDGRQIRDSFRAVYPDIPAWYEEHTTGFWRGYGEGMVRDMRQLVAFIAGLDSSTRYALVALESS